LQEVQAELLDYQHQSGMSIMEMSHRSKEFGVILHKAKEELRKLLRIPSHYRILFMQGKST